MKNIRISCSFALYTLIIVAMLCFTTIVCCAQTVTHVKLTCYQPVKSQCNNQPLITADGSKINLHHLKTNKVVSDKIMFYKEINPYNDKRRSC